MPSAAETVMRALRRTAALSELDHVAAVRVSGADAFAALDLLVPAELFVRDGQMLHTLLLRPTGEPAADLYVCRDDEQFVLLAEGMTAAAIAAHAAEHLPRGLAVAFEDLSETRAILSLNGPFAWEVLVGLIGPDVISIPYLTFFGVGEGELLGRGAGGRRCLCFRAGKTGEFGFDLLVPREAAAAVRARVVELGAAFGLAVADLAALDQCALENGFFSMRAGRLEGLTPLELQLQWRLSTRKDFVGAAALRQRRAEGPRVRSTHLCAAGELEPGDPVLLGERRVGEVFAAGWSLTRGDWVGQALLERGLAHPGLTELVAVRGGGAVALRTHSAPLINNRSLYVDPRRHSVRDLGPDGDGAGGGRRFPPLVLPEQRP